MDRDHAHAGRLDQQRRTMAMWILVLMYGATIVCAVVLIAKGRVELGVVGALLAMTLGPVAFVSLLSGAWTRERLSGRMDDLAEEVRQLSTQAALSDDARRVLNRSHERALLRAAIDEDVAMRNWDAALVLVNELAERFGYRADAEEYRAKIDMARRSTVERDLAEAIAQVDGYIVGRQWEQAGAEVAKVRRLFPDSPKAQQLPQRVHAAFQAYKADLERRFHVAASEDRADDAMMLLKELDTYLTPQEAEPMREVARGVIGKARDNLGAQFKLAVQDRRWMEAVNVGDAIIEQFPNSRMAAEVRDVIDGVRARASGQRPLSPI
jgi:hypothetical protein